MKATNTGIVVLKETRYKKRYLGSKTHHVRFDGQLMPGNGIIKPPAEDQKKTPVNTTGDYPKIRPINQGRSYTINKQQVRHRLLGYINTQKGKKELYFWTVTFPMKTGDDQIYKIFNIWLTTLRQKKFLQEYIWVCERQKNGTLHFHLAIPHKMSVVAANRFMQITLAGCVKRGEIDYTVYQCKRYNGVDIAKNRNTRRVTNFAIKKGSRTLSQYLTKYVTKNDDNFSHLAWHNSRGFSALFTGITFTGTEFRAYGFHRCLNLDAGRRFETEFIVFIPWNDMGPPAAIENHLYDLNSHIQNFN